MIFKTYPKYRNSGIEWIGDIPEHWDIRRLKFLVSQRLQYGANEPSGLKNNVWPRYVHIMDIASNGSLRPETVCNISPEISAPYFLREGDILFARVGSTVGKTFCYQRKWGKAAFAGNLIKARIDNNKIDTKFVYYFTKSLIYNQWIANIFSKSTIQNISAEKYASLWIPLPPKTEQYQITRFLYYKCAKINRFIRNKHRLIELLKEQKQAIINQAVTCGLDSNVKLKPSGLSWLGDIPEHWESFRLGQICHLNPSKAEATATIHKTDYVTFLSMESITTEGKISCSDKRQMIEVCHGFTYFRRGDIVIAKITPCFENGKGAYLSELETEFGFGTTELIVLRPMAQVNGLFIYWLTRSSMFRILGERFMVGSAGQKRVPSSYIKSFPIGLPSYEEQLAIIDYIEARVQVVDKHINRAQIEIELIQEYRARLISDVVTGKIDLRNVKVDEVSIKDKLNEFIEETKPII